MGPRATRRQTTRPSVVRSDMDMKTMKWIPCLAFAAISISAMADRGTAVSYPWAFDEGNDTSRSMVHTLGSEVLQKAGYTAIPYDRAKHVWSSNGFGKPYYGDMPSRETIRKFGQALHVDKVLYGNVSWHTRSIWVNVGPHTISTATMNVYIMDVATGKIEYQRKGVVARSDEKENGAKIAGDVLLTPLVTAVSGGPATPREQRAVQLAMGHALHDWVRRDR